MEKPQYLGFKLNFSNFMWKVFNNLDSESSSE
jgi:hypothetical protein